MRLILRPRPRDCISDSAHGVIGSRYVFSLHTNGVLFIKAVLQCALVNCYFCISPLWSTINRVNIESTPVILLIFQQRVQIFAWKFTQLLSNETYTLMLSFVELYLKMIKLCCFNQDNSLFLNVPSVVFASSLLVALKTAGLLVMRWGCRREDRDSNCRCSKWPPLATTAMQAVKRLMKFATALLMCFCGSSYKITTKQLSSCHLHESSYALAGLYGAFQHDTPDIIL